MMRTVCLLSVPVAAILTFGLALSAAAGPVPLVFDTDMGNDIDDALALALIHCFERHGECRLIAVTLTNDHRYAAPFVDLVNTFYGRGDVPIGVVRGGVTHGDGNYLQELACAEDNGRPRYPHKLRDGSEAPEATALLRRVLAAQADGSVVVAQVGFSTNLARLLDSKPDAASPLDGKALVRRKVRFLSAMAGNFGTPRGDRFKEFNVATDVASAKKLFEQWPAPIVFSGFEVGNAILYPHGSIEHDYKYVPHHPVAEAYQLYMKMPYDRPTWDLTAALYAVRFERCPFGLSPRGRVSVEDGGVTRFQPEEGGPHRYLTVNREQARGVRDAFADMCSEVPACVTERQKQDAELARRQKFHSTRATAETRVRLENQSLRLDFDPRTSGTDYNYIWVRRPGTDRWERIHNFGVDVDSFDSADQREMNFIGMDLALQRAGRAINVTYPSPLVQYRQFDDRIGTPETIRKYPDYTSAEARRLIHADASIAFRYEIDPERPSFVLSGRVLEGRINSVVYIIDALWTDNHFLPTHELVEGKPEYDPARPEDKKACAQVTIEKVRYAIFYRRDGEGVPFALLPLVPDRARVCNYFDNWKCLYDFHNSELNQQFVAEDPPVTGANDTGYITAPRADGTLPPVRVAFFPELGWGQGGRGDELRARIVRAIQTSYPAAWGTYPALGTIERLDPRFDQLVPRGAVLEKLAEGFKWSEGPVWIGQAAPGTSAGGTAGGHLLFSDIPNNAVMRWKDGEGISVFLKPSGYTGTTPRGGELGSNGLTLDAAGRLVLCQHGDRRIVRREADGRWTTLVDRYQGKRLNSPNDLVFKSNGDLYFTDPPYGLPSGGNDPARELDFTGVFRVSAADGKVTLLTKELSGANGIAFSPDEKTLYVSQSDPRKAIWMAYPVKADGTLAAGRVFYDATRWTTSLKGVPDGMKIDRAGNLFAAGPGGINVFSPDGTLLGRINPGEPTANCAFGEDGSVLYVAANQYLCRIKLATKGDPPGKR